MSQLTNHSLKESVKNFRVYCGSNKSVLPCCI